MGAKDRESRNPRVLAIDARRTLLIDRAAFLERANAERVAVFGLDPAVGAGKADA